MYVAVSNDQLFVADWGCQCIFVFTLDGSKYDTRWTVNEPLNAPCGIAIDKCGYHLRD